VSTQFGLTVKVVQCDNGRQEHTCLLRQRQRRVPLHQPGSASADEACGD
jgi:hypothetical protein